MDVSIGKVTIVFRRLRNLTANVKGRKKARAVRPYHYSSRHQEDLLRFVDKKLFPVTLQDR